MKNDKKTMLFHHEFLAVLRCISPDKAMMAINALCDIDLGIEPEITDPAVKSLVEMKRQSVLENRKKYDEATDRMSKAREERAKKSEDGKQNQHSLPNNEDRTDRGCVRTEINTDISNKNSDIRTEISTDISTEIKTDINSSSSSSSSYIQEEEEYEESRAKKYTRGGQSPPEDDSSSSSVSASRQDTRKQALPKQTSPPVEFSNAASVWEIIRTAWNGHNCRYTADKIYLNLSPAQRERVSGSMATYSPDQMTRAIARYFKEREDNPDGYEYKSFYLFVEKGLEFYVET
jgi:hypothetical protein